MKFCVLLSLQYGQLHSNHKSACAHYIMSTMTSTSIKNSTTEFAPGYMRNFLPNQCQNPEVM